MAESTSSGEDLISRLPDGLIQHILSFLPSTMYSVQTSVLSKSWLLQWSLVPVLVFSLYDNRSDRFSDFIDKALSLYGCSQIKKFVIDSGCIYLDDLGSKLASWIHFALARNVQELILDCLPDAYDDYYYPYVANYRLPQFLFESASLVKFGARHCALVPGGNVSWASLKALNLTLCDLPNHAIEHVLSGCPVIECLELTLCDGFQELVVVSESLKMLYICASRTCTAIEICCPNMEKLDLLYFGCSVPDSLELKDLPPSVSVSLDLKIGAEVDEKTVFDLFKFVKKILLQVRHVEELSLGGWILMILRLGVARGEPFLPLNSKCLMLLTSFKKTRVQGLVFLLRNFPVLEKLKMQLSGRGSFQRRGLVKDGKKFWEHNESLFSSLMPSLKTVEIEILSDVKSKKYDKLLEFAKFILKNARVLEKMAFIAELREEMDFVNEICHKLSGVQKSSPHAVVEVARIPRGYMRRAMYVNGTTVHIEAWRLSSVF